VGAEGTPASGIGDYEPAGRALDDRIEIAPGEWRVLAECTAAELEKGREALD